MHVVAVLHLDTAVAFDLAVPAFVFGSACAARDATGGGRALYEVRVCGPEAGTRTATGGGAAFDVGTAHSWADAAGADTVVVPGLASYAAPPPPAVLDLLRAAHASGARVASICNGVFTVAAAGLLDGRRATVHGSHARELAARYPAVEVDPAVLFVDNGDVVTSAGGAAGLDMCLHLVGKDHGAAVAAGTARHTVMPLRRDGGQAQFIAHEQTHDDRGGLGPLMHRSEESLGQPHTLAGMAREASMSVRTLSRRFRAQTGTTPLRWLTGARLQRARHLLETTGLSVEEIASRAGFGTATVLRQHFRRALGTSPLAYRRAFTGARPD